MDINCIAKSLTGLQKIVESNKIKVGRRTTPLDENKETPIVKKKSTDPFSLASKQLDITVKARVCSKNKAVFQFKDSIDDCYLYKILTTKKRKHLYYLENQNINDLKNLYKTPWDTTTFTYHTAKYFNAHDAQDNICLVDKCIDELCEITLKVHHYDHTGDDQKRHIGIKINVSKIKIL